MCIKDLVDDFLDTQVWTDLGMFQFILLLILLGQNVEGITEIYKYVKSIILILGYGSLMSYDPLIRYKPHFGFGGHR